MHAPSGAPKPSVGGCRKSRRRSALFKNIDKLTAFVLGLALAAVTVRSLHFNRALPSAIRNVAGDSAFTPVEDQGRKIYLYSVLPGGVRSSEELAERLNSDKVAARHYSDYQVNRAVLSYARFDRQSAYVSYRSGDRIFWTKKRVHVEPTELVLTDGKNFARTRCGNRLSETPQEPTADDEPTEEALLYSPPLLPNRLLRLPSELEDPPALTLKSAYEFPSIDTKIAWNQVSAVRPLLLTTPLNPIAVSIQPVGGTAPEPASLLLFASGIVVFAVIFRKLPAVSLAQNRGQTHAEVWQRCRAYLRSCESARR